MNSMPDTCREYEESIAVIRSRVDELSQGIATLRREDGMSEAREMEQRRHRLYANLTHMEESLADMKAYLGA